MEPEVVERLDRFIGKMRVKDLQNADSVLERFAETEDSRRIARKWAINIGRGSFTVGITLSLWFANKAPIHWWHYTVWAFSAFLVFVSVYSFRTEPGEHLACIIREGSLRVAFSGMRSPKARMAA